ncbi:MAG: cell envelope integrity protein CreD [Bacteroidales bacterium]|nr:cell envelope integrity protein CreD [Bacteroidales bacterium]
MKRQLTKLENLLLKIFILGILALVMLIPLALVKGQISSRNAYHEISVDDITSSWGGSQTILSPTLRYGTVTEKVTFIESGSGKEREKKVELEEGDETVLPMNVDYRVSASTEILHRSVFKVPVYTATIHVEGSFLPGHKFSSAQYADLSIGISDLRGIQGAPTLTIGGKGIPFRSSRGAICAKLYPEEIDFGSDSISFSADIQLRGSRSLLFAPGADLTNVTMSSDYPEPSFTGDFLPGERSVTPEGFSASWTVSQINCDSLVDPSFGVTLVQSVTGYRQTERAVKYGLLVILLVFMAGFVVEMVSGKTINLLQYLVIGASLVLFYSLLLAFSEFIPFGWAYLIACVMTVGALVFYFRGMVKSSYAFAMGGLVALVYGIIYILLGMETFAFLSGTVLLFAILLVIMALTRKINTTAEFPKEESRQTMR